jgi:hypothetical protein
MKMESKRAVAVSVGFTVIAIVLGKPDIFANAAADAAVYVYSYTTIGE